MADHIELALGARPWHPSGATEDVIILDRYDMPLSGIVEQHGSSYLFRCMAGELDDGNLWLYVLLDYAGRQSLLKAEGDDLDLVMDNLTAGRPITLAIASSQDGIFLHATTQAADTRHETVARGIAAIETAMDEYRRALKVTEKAAKHLPCAA
jgi:hypothetical protein